MNTAKVWKFPIDIISRPILHMPQGAQIVKVDTQQGEPFVWALVNPTNEKEERRFYLAGTGHEIEDIDSKTHVGSFFMAEQRLVWHLFEINVPGALK